MMRKLRKEVKAFVNFQKIKDFLPHSYDVIGHVAIIEIPNGMEKFKADIARAIIELNKHIKTVLEKASERRGIYRRRKYKLIAGKRKTETLHKEYGCVFRLDPRKVYFSPRELTERQRIAKQVKAGERVLVPFSGVAPFPVIIAKQQPKVKEVCGIEINPVAHKYARENIRINRVEDKITLILGDVRRVCPKLKKKFDRIVMPLPKGGHKFLDVVIPCLKSPGIVHFYHWASEDDLFGEARRIVKEAVSKLNKRFRVLKLKKVLPYGPRKWKVVLDIRVKNR